MATVKNVGLAPINLGDAKKYSAMQSPAYKEEFWQKMSATNDIDYYMSLLNQADKKGLKIEDFNFKDLDDVDDQWAAFYMEAGADDTELKDYGQGLANKDEEPWGELTEKQYLSKVLDKKREYNIWLKEEAEIAAQKEAMSGWDKFWNGVGAWFTELGYSLEQIPLSLLDLFTNWDGGESVGFIEDWRQDTLRRQQELADYERRYTYLRDVETWEPTFGGQLAIGSAQTLGLMLPSMVMNYIVPGSGFYIMYGNMFAQNVYEARHNPNIDATWYEIIIRATLMTAAEAAIEKWMGPSLLDDVVLNGKRFTKEMVKVTTWEGIKILGKDIIHEAAEEALQELSSNLVNMTLSLGNSTWEEYIPENLAEDIALASLMGGIFAAGNITFGVLANDIKTGRVVRNITRKFKAGDIISDYNTKPSTKKGKVDTKTDTKGFHASNFFERIAINANFNTFSKNLKLAKQGKLSMDQKQLLYNQTMALGAIFNSTDTSQIRRSMELLTQLESYMKQEGIKEETIKKADTLYLDSLLMNLKAVQSDAAAKFWGNKITQKEAAKLAKEARISKTKKEINKKNVEEITKAFDDNTKDTKKKARKKAVKTLVEEGKTIVTTDGQKLELTEDVVFVPEPYLDNGDPSYIVRSALEKDIAQEFVVYMKSPKRLVGWSQAKAALIKAYPEMGPRTETITLYEYNQLPPEEQKNYTKKVVEKKTEKTGPQDTNILAGGTSYQTVYTREVEGYTDQQIARNLLFNPGAAATLVSILPNSDFNILFLNMMEGLKQVAYKTDVAKAVKNKTIKQIEDNFRYAARMFCANNIGVNPHDLHNVLTKADQIFVKNERAKLEAEEIENARKQGKVFSKQSLGEDVEEPNIEDSYKKASKKGGLTLYSGTLERKLGGPNFFEDQAAFNELYQAAEEVEVGQYITPPKPLWTSQSLGIGYGPGTNIDGDRSVQWEISIGPEAPVDEKSVTFYEGNNSMSFDQVPILVESKAIDENGNIFIKGRIGGESYYKEDPSAFTKRQYGEFKNQEGASFTTPEYGNETYKSTFNDMLKPSLSDMERSGLTIQDVVNDPETYLAPEIIEYILNNFGDLSKNSTYLGLRSWLIGETDGTKTITVNENGKRYYFADVTNVKVWNTNKISEPGNEDPNGTSLIKKYKGKTVDASEFWKGEALVGKAKNVKIEFKETGGNFYSAEQNKIFIDLSSELIKNNLDFLFALNHEFQHALQATNRTQRGFSLGLDIPKELVEEVKREFPGLFKKGMTPEEERKKANEIIYDYSGEMEAFQHATDFEDYAPFIIAVKDYHYIIFTPSGKGPYVVPFGRVDKAETPGTIINKNIYRGTSENTFEGKHLMTYFTDSEENAKHYTGEKGKVDKYNFKADKADMKVIDMGGNSWDMFNDEIFYFDEETGKWELDESLPNNKELKKAITGVYKDLDKIDPDYSKNPPEVAKLLQEIADGINQDPYHSMRSLKINENSVEHFRPLLEYLKLPVNEYALLYTGYLVDFNEMERFSTETVLLKYKLTYPNIKGVIFENIQDPDLGNHYVLFPEGMGKESLQNRSNLNKRLVNKDVWETTNLKYFKKKGKKLRVHEDLQAFVINAKDLDKLDEWVSTRIKNGTLSYRKLMKWFKEAPNINEYTFKHMREAFWPNSPILTFEELSRIALGLTFDIDKDGNFVEVKFRSPKDANGHYDEFTINEDAYRVAIMEHWEGPADIKKMRRIVGATEIIKHAESFTELQEKVGKNSDDGDMDIDDIIGATEDFTEAVLNDTPRTKKAEILRKIIVRKVGAKAQAGEWDYAKSKAMLDKYTIEYFEELPEDQLNKLYLKEAMKKAEIKTNEKVIDKVLKRNRKNAVANIKGLGTTIWNNTAPKNRSRLPKQIQEMFDEKGKIKTEVFKGKPQGEIVRIEEELKEVALKARRGDYASTEVEKAYAQVEKLKKQIEKQKNKAKTQVKSTTKVVTEYVTNIKTEAKVIQVQTTKKETPSKLEKLLSTNFTKKRMSNLQELDNFEYYVSEREVFRKENAEILDSITEAEWIEIVEWFEQSEFVGTEGDLGTFKAIRMFILADLVSRIKTHNIVLDNTWSNRANQIMTSNVHSSAVEMATWGKVLNSINPFRQLAEEYNISEETVDNIQAALETDNDEELAKAIDELRLEIAENYVEKNLMEKVLAFRYTAMLSGPTTWLRNLISNFIVKHFNKWSAGIGEKLVGKKLQGYQGYKLVGTKVRTDVAEFIKVNLLDTGLLHQLTEGYSKYDPYTAERATKVDKDYIVRTMVNNFNKKFEQDNAYGSGKAAQVFNKFSAFVRKMISDDKFVNEATLRYFGKMLTEDIESGRLSAELLREGIFNKELVTRFAEAQWLAMSDYMKNTNFMTKAMSALNENRWAKYIMPLIMPFAQSSWNWWVETMRYSPFGLGVSIIRLIKYDKYVERMEAKRNSSVKGQSASVQGAMLDKYMAVRELGKGIIGTALWTTGIILAATGVVGLSRKDEDKYVIHLGPIELDVSNYFGSSSFLAGAALVGAIKDGKWWEMFNVTIDQMARTLFVTDLISSFKFQTIGEYVMDLPLNVLYSFVPNFIKMISTNVQVYKVKYDSGILGDLERMASGLIPGLSYAFPAEIDPFTGKKKFHRIPILTQAGGISYNDISEAERAAIAVGVGAGQLTGEITVGDEKVQLDREKVNVYRGEFTNKFMTDLLNDQYLVDGKRYSKMDEKERKKAIQSILNKSANYAKIKVWTEMGNKYYASKELYFTLKSLGITNVYQGSGGYIKKK